MTSRPRDRDRDRRFDDDDRGDRRPGRRDTDRRPIRDEPPREPKKAKGTTGLNSYFIKGEGIHREVLQKEICRFLGPEATSKPDEYNGVSGFMIKAVRTFTPEMLDDLIDLSRGYVSERKEKERRGLRGMRYDQSDISRGRESLIRRGGQDVEMDDEDDDYDDDYRDNRPRPTRNVRDVHDTRDYLSRGSHDLREPQFQPPNPYSSGPSSTSSYAPTTSYPQAPYSLETPLHQQGSPFAQGPSGYPVPGTRPEGNYAYSSEYGGSSDPYVSRQPGGYPVPGPREPVRQDHRDVRGYQQSTRIETRDLRGPRVGDQPRFYQMSSPGDVPMSGMDDDRYSYPTASTSQTSRDPYTGSSRPAPSPYERTSPEPYRPPPPREERRQRR